jgi:hypothetical protein
MLGNDMSNKGVMEEHKIEEMVDRILSGFNGGMDLLTKKVQGEKIIGQVSEHVKVNT